MRISVPFSYQVKAIPYKHKLESTLTMLENMWVDVPEMEAGNLALALVVRDVEGRDIERVYACGGDFWVRDSRNEGDLPFLEQHLPAAGQRIPGTRQSAHPLLRESEELSGATTLLGKVGMLRTRTAGIGGREARHWIVNRPEGHEFIEITVDTEKARSVSSSDREERLQRARRLAMDQTIAVDGVLYHRVAEPCIISDSNHCTEMKWRFGCPDFLTPAGIAKNSGYPVSAKDFERVHDWFDEPDRAVTMRFSFDVLDETYFKIRADRIALVSSAQRVVSDGLYNENTTPYIAKWCELRDCLAALLRAPDAPLTAAGMLARDDHDFERLAGLLEEIGEFGETRRYGGKLDLQGLKMWDSRAVALEMAHGGPHP
ncbi:hypothetical protein GOB57_21030 [Sinorhizobium meliloti]|nr:hypothetical protein [Sinorhizobium meliloti]